MGHKQRTRLLLPPLLIILAGQLAYWNSLDGVFLYDDIPSICENPYIRALWPLDRAMSIPLWSSATTVDCRPLLSLSFALNYAVFGPAAWGYRLVNMMIHIASGLLLFGIIRRTLELPQFRKKYAERGRWLAAVAALIWLVHPLQTESVTYIVQRAESLMGMLYLTTLYCAIRGWQVASGGWQGGERGKREEDRTSNVQHPTSSGAGRAGMGWCIAAVVACAIGMGVKQIMFSGPLLVLLYDWVFISGGFRAAIGKRKGFYLSLFATWLILFGIIGATWKESTIDFVEISPIQYLMTQPMVLLHYLRLSFWPSPLVLAYGWPFEDQLPRIVFPGLFVLGMVSLMLRGIYRRRWHGYLLAWFFLILAPTSSISPLRQVISEHRMYLPLAALVVLGVVVSDFVIRKIAVSTNRRAFIGGGLAMALVVTYGYLTHERNKDYHSAVRIWRHNVDHSPASTMARSSLGWALREAGLYSEAIAEYREALMLAPGEADLHKDLGDVLVAAGRTDEAIAEYQQALLIAPRYPEVHIRWGYALEAAGRREEGILHYREAVRLRPDMPRAYLHLAHALQAAGSLEEALSCFRRATELDPYCADAHNNFGVALEAAGRPNDAIRMYRQALRIDPNCAEFHSNLGNTFSGLGRQKEAMRHYQQAVQIDAWHIGARNNLGIIYREMGNMTGAIEQFKQVLRLDPTNGIALENLSMGVEMIDGD